MNREKFSEVIQKSCKKLMATKGYVSPDEAIGFILKEDGKNDESDK